MKDLVQRGDKRSSPGTKALYVLLRTFDLWFQHHLLTTPSTAQYLHENEHLPLHPYHVIMTAHHEMLYKTPHGIIMLLVLATWAKQVFGALVLSQERLALRSALIAATWQNVFSTLMTVAYICVPTTSLSGSGHWQIRGVVIPMSGVIGFAIFAAGLAVELLSETHRRAFKFAKGNEDKVLRKGMWALARHPNYGGHVLWRTGYAMAASGYIAAIVVFAIHFAMLALVAVPQIEEYCERHYGSQWLWYQDEVRWVMFPRIY